jgi:hypothetical protein
MLRLSRVPWLVLPALLVAGCPVYSDGCVVSADCDYGYYCDEPSGQCLAVSKVTPEGTSGPARCETSSDCDEGLVCDRYKRCMPPEGAAGGSGTAGEGGTAGAP